jgi:hypothetical protein
MSAIRYWRVTFRDTGTVASVTEIAGPGHDGWVVVEAPDEKVAKRKAYNIYCARKKQVAKVRLHGAGKCCCGRQQDRKHPSGKWMLTCSTCAERQKVWDANHAKRKAEGTVGQGIAERNEPARVAANLERQRDRRGEIRLETLVDVRDAWIKAPNIGAFSKWLEREIDALTGARKSA